MQGIWQNHGRRDQEFNNSEYQKIVYVVIKTAESYDCDDAGMTRSELREKIFQQ